MMNSTSLIIITKWAIYVHSWVTNLMTLSFSTTISFAVSLGTPSPTNPIQPRPSPPPIFTQLTGKWCVYKFKNIYISILNMLKWHVWSHFRQDILYDLCSTHNVKTGTVVEMTSIPLGRSRIATLTHKKLHFRINMSMRYFLSLYP